MAADFANRSIDRPLAVLLIDIDDFKLVNDTFGHEAGDEVLSAVGQRLLATVREGDIAARLGGDEFVIALPVCADQSIPAEVATRVLAAFAEPFAIGSRRLAVGATIGVAVAGPDTRTPDDLVRNADAAMYLAKNRGKGRFEVYEPSMQTAAIADLQLRTDLASGIDAGELRLHFQPVIDLRTGRTVGYEALVRWLHEGRLIPPGSFIPIAEASGLIAPLTDWVVDEACRVAASWDSPDRPWVSVNLSPSQLVRADIVAHLGRSLMVRDSTRTTRHRDHRVFAAGDRRRASGPHPVERAGCPTRDGRLRHRVLSLELSRPPADRHRQDRPIVRRGPPGGRT